MCGHFSVIVRPERKLLVPYEGSSDDDRAKGAGSGSSLQGVVMLRSGLVTSRQ